MADPLSTTVQILLSSGIYTLVLRGRTVKSAAICPSLNLSPLYAYAPPSFGAEV